MTSAQSRLVIVVLGLTQILAWGSSFYLLSVLAPSIAGETGWSSSLVLGGLSIAMLVAGLISPRIGAAIHRTGGRPVLAASSVLFALGLASLSLSTSAAAYLASWGLIGFAMGAGLYDPAFATLGRHFGHSARRMITAVTLFGGFASTVCWPLSAYLLESFGWRTTCAAYAVLHLCIGLPSYLLLLPKRPPDLQKTFQSTSPSIAPLSVERQLVAQILLGATFSIGALILSMVSAHLLVLLQTRGLDLASAVAFGALIGPSQVGARVLEITIGRRIHPLWTMFTGLALVDVGVAVLWTNLPVLSLALIIYGAGNGIASIVRGTVPLVLFGPGRYAVLMGRLGLPILLAMALAPSLGALLMEAGGAALIFLFLNSIATLNVVLCVILIHWCRRRY